MSESRERRMSKYSELADRLYRKWPSLGTIGTGLHEDLSEAATALRELEAELHRVKMNRADLQDERDRLREALKPIAYRGEISAKIIQNAFAALEGK
jgi:hypothetical protein